MAIDKTKFRTMAPVTVTFDTTDEWGAVSEEGIKLTLDNEVLEIRPGQSLAPLVRLIKANAGSLEFTALEITPEKLDKILNTKTPTSGSGTKTFTADVARALVEHTLSLVVSLSDGSTWTIAGTVVFKPSAEITMKIDEEGKLPVHVDFIPDIDADYKLFTITEVAAS